MAVSLKERIDFITEEVIKDGSIIKGKKEVVKYSCSASFLDVSGAEFNSANATWEKHKASFRVRYCNFTKNLNTNTKKYQIKFNGNLYNIEFASDYKQKHVWIDIKATLIK